VVPVARSPRSTSVVAKPRMAASRATPAPVEPPPTTRTSVSSVGTPTGRSIAAARDCPGTETVPETGCAPSDVYRDSPRSGTVPKVDCVLVEPVEGPRDGLLPERVLLFALGRVHLGLPLLVLAPVGAQVLDLRPEADREAGRVGGAERCGLDHRRPDHRHVEHVGLE